MSEHYETDKKCKCCDGSGTQLNRKTGIIERCPCCDGSGKWRPPNKEKNKRIWS